MHRRTRILETPRGTGKVTRQNSRQVIATVEYRLQVARDDLIDPRSGDTTEGLRDTRGTITQMDGEPLDLGETLTLYLQDGRCADFFITFSGLAGPQKITVSGGLRAC